MDSNQRNGCYRRLTSCRQRLLLLRRGSLEWKEQAESVISETSY